jgi:hypothetical protein
MTKYFSFNCNQSSFERGIDRAEVIIMIFFINILFLVQSLSAGEKCLMSEATDCTNETCTVGTSDWKYCTTRNLRGQKAAIIEEAQDDQRQHDSYMIQSVEDNARESQKYIDSFNTR